MKILSALLTPLLACITVYIAYRQWRDKQLRLRIDNYERRLRIYQEVVKMLQRINEDFKPKWDDLLSFNGATAEAAFLFDDEIPAYIDEIITRGNNLRVDNIIYRAGTETQPRDADEYQRALEDMHVQNRWFVDQPPIAREKFKAYLDVTSQGWRAPGRRTRASEDLKGISETPDALRKSFLAVKKSEAGWIEAMDGFSLTFASPWFEFVKRLLILGGLRYLRDHGGNWFVTVFYVLSLATFLLYLWALLFSFDFYRVLPDAIIKKHPRFARLFSLIVAALVALAINHLLNSAIVALATK
jgi:hypothetical protein